MTHHLRRRYGGAQDAEVTPVIFRVWPASEGGGVIALFPTLPADYSGDSCESYEHVGQHGGADCEGLIPRTRAAKPEEYVSLKRELESPPYNYRLKVYTRVSRTMRDQRRKAAT